MSVVAELDAEVAGKREEASDDVVELCCLWWANAPYAPAPAPPAGSAAAPAPVCALGRATSSFVYENTGFVSMSSNSN